MYFIALKRWFSFRDCDYFGSYKPLNRTNFLFVVDLRKVSNEEKLNICRKYYLAGFALLPFLWAVNAAWFFRYAFGSTEFPEQKRMRRYVIQSMVGSILWLVVLVIWISIFQLNRASWGAIADQISFIIPLNRL